MRRKAFTLIELLVVIAIIAILAAILFPVFAKARDKARQSSCQSNLKQLGVAVTQYCQDYDEMLPSWYFGAAPSGTSVTWDLVIQPYLKSSQVLTCPSDSSSSVINVPEYGGNVRRSYTYPTNTSGGNGTGSTRALASVNAPALTVLFCERTNSIGGANSWQNYARCESLGDQLNFRHNDAANYAYVDGHVKTLVGHNGTGPWPKMEGYNAWGNGSGNCDNGQPIPTG